MTEKSKAPDGTINNPIEVKAEWRQQCGHPIAVTTCPKCFLPTALSPHEEATTRHKGICANCYTFLVMVTSGTKPETPAPFSVGPLVK